MFDQYNLIHFEVTRPLIQDRIDQIESSVTSSNYSLASQLVEPSNTDIFSNMQGVTYRITGSFDFLPPPIREDTTEALAGRGLFLQSFGIMNNGPDYYTHREYYDSLLLSYTYSGEGVLNYLGQSYPIRQGTGFLIDCRIPHEYRTTGDHWEHADIHFSGKQAATLYSCFKQYGIVTFTYAASAFNQMVDELLYVYTNLFSMRNLYVENALSTILCMILKNSEKEGFSRIPTTYRHIVRYMESNYMYPLSLDELSERFHVSKYHMSREFKKHTGYSPGDYLVMLRVQHASILLSQSDLSVESVAMQSGFGNMSNFNSQIKKRTGMTPSALRKASKSRF